MNIKITQKVIVEEVTINLSKQEAQVLSSILSHYKYDFRKNSICPTAYESYKLASTIEEKLRGI